MGLTAALMAVGTAISYKGARDQAKAMEYQAQAVRQQAEYNATIQRQAGQQEQEVAQFRAASQARKKTDALLALERTLEATSRKGLYEIGKLQNKGAYMGADFDFVLESGMQDLFAQETDALIKASTAGAQFDAQSEEFMRQGVAAYQNGITKSNLTIMAGNNKATDLENAAATTRTNALGSAFSGFAQAGEMAS